MRTQGWKKELVLVLLIILASLFVRSFGLGASLFDDETMYGRAVANAGNFGFNPNHYTPILMQWLQLPVTSLWGFDSWVLKLVPLLFGLLIMFISYLISRQLFGSRAAKITLLLIGFSFYPILSSLQLDVEGSLMTFFYLLAVYSLFQIEEKNLLKWKVTCGLALFFSLLSKHNAVLIFAILFVYVLIKDKFHLKKVIRKLFIPFSIGIGGYMFFLGFAYLIDPKNLSMMFGHGSQFFTGIYFSSIALPILFFWGTPLLLGSAFLAMWYRKRLSGEKSLIFYAWLIIVLLFYVFIIEWGDYSRYLANLVPPMAILGGNFLSKFRIRFKEIVCCGMGCFSLLGVFFWLNSFPSKLVPRFFEKYLAEILNLNLNFLFSYTTSSGPAFGVNFFIILFSLAAGFLFVILFIILRNRQAAKMFLFAFLVVGLAFNFFLVAEFLFHPTSPDVSSVQYALADYFVSEELDYPVFSNEEGVLFNINNKFNADLGLVDIPDNELEMGIEKHLSRVQSGGGTLLVLNWPPIPEESPTWVFAEECGNVIKEFYSKGILLGKVYDCG